MELPLGGPTDQNGAFDLIMVADQLNHLPAAAFFRDEVSPESTAASADWAGAFKGAPHLGQTGL